MTTASILQQLEALGSEQTRKVFHNHGAPLDTMYGVKVGDLKPYYLDLLSHRDISRKIAELFDVEHQSPQAILVQNGEAIYDASHYDISFAEIAEKI